MTPQNDKQAAHHWPHQHLKSSAKVVQTDKRDSDVERLTQLLSQAEQRATRAEAACVERGRQLDKLLAHCEMSECGTCGEIICPHKCSFHFHHDGCPACAESPTDDTCGSSITKKLEAATQMAHTIESYLASQSRYGFKAMDEALKAYQEAKDSK